MCFRLLLLVFFGGNCELSVLQSASGKPSIIVMKEIFISYAREDLERVKPIVAALERQGWSVFWDRTIPIGQTWRSYIGNALENASCVIAVWSGYSVESNWVSQEADEAKNRKMYVPLLLDPVTPPFGFRETQAADLASWNGDESDPQFVLLCNAIASLVTQKKSIVQSDPDSTGTTPRDVQSSAGDGESGSGSSDWRHFMEDKRKLMLVGLPLVAAVVLSVMFFTREKSDRIMQVQHNAGQVAPESVGDEKIIDQAIEKVVSDLDMNAEQDVNQAIQEALSKLDGQTDQIIPENVAQPVGDKRWDWTIYLDASRSTLSKIKCVEYTLHKTFNPPVRMVCDPTNGFALSSNGWGTFEVKIKIMYKDGRTEDLTHMLKFN